MAGSVGSHDYGKSDITFFTVNRSNAQHDIREIRASVVFEGDFSAAYSDGDNRSVLPTGSMINAVFALAVDHLGSPLEELARFVAEHFLESTPAVRKAKVDFFVTAWERLERDGQLDPTGFSGAQRENTTVSAAARRNEPTVLTSGVAGLRLLKTSGTQFTGFHRDEFTDLSDVLDRLVAFTLDIGWEFDPERVDSIDFEACWAVARAATLREFSRHHSFSGQHTLYVLATAALEAVPELRRVHLTIVGQDDPIVDLSLFGRENPNLVYATPRNPYGVVRLTVDRDADSVTRSQERR